MTFALSYRWSLWKMAAKRFCVGPGRVPSRVFKVEERFKGRYLSHLLSSMVVAAAAAMSFLVAQRRLSVVAHAMYYPPHPHPHVTLIFGSFIRDSP